MAGFRHLSGPVPADIARQLSGFRDGRVRQQALGVVARELTAAHRAGFAAEASPEGVAWLPLKRPRPGKILHLSGALETAATSPVFRGSAVAFLLPVYGARQHFGYPAGALDHPPPRPFMALAPIPHALQQRLGRAMAAMLREQIR